MNTQLKNSTVMTGGLDPKRKKVIILMAVALLVLVGVFCAGYRFGKNKGEKVVADQVARVSEQNLTEGIELKLFNQTVRLTGKATEDKSTMLNLLNSVSAEDLQKGSYDDLIRAYGFAHAVDDETVLGRIKKALKAERSRFTKEQQQALTELGI